MNGHEQTISITKLISIDLFFFFHWIFMAIAQCEIRIGRLEHRILIAQLNEWMWCLHTCSLLQQLYHVADGFWTNCPLVWASARLPVLIHVFSLDLDRDLADTIRAIGSVYALWNSASSVRHPKWCVAMGTFSVRDIYQRGLKENWTNLQFSIGYVAHDYLWVT